MFLWILVFQLHDNLAPCAVSVWPPPSIAHTSACHVAAALTSACHVAGALTSDCHVVVVLVVLPCLSVVQLDPTMLLESPYTSAATDHR